MGTAVSRTLVHNLKLLKFLMASVNSTMLAVLLTVT